MDVEALLPTSIFLFSAFRQHRAEISVDLCCATTLHLQLCRWQMTSVGQLNNNRGKHQMNPLCCGSSRHCKENILPPVWLGFVSSNATMTVFLLIILTKSSKNSIFQNVRVIECTITFKCVMGC